jgi:hypothetical protein
MYPSNNKPARPNCSRAWRGEELSLRRLFEPVINSAIHRSNAASNNRSDCGLKGAAMRCEDRIVELVVSVNCDVAVPFEGNVTELELNEQVIPGGGFRQANVNVSVSPFREVPVTVNVDD